MALINCPECGKQVSDQAEVCMNCGFKILGTENLHELSKKKEEEIIQEKKDKNNSVIAIIVTIVVIGIIGWFIWFQSTADDRARRNLQKSIDKFNQTQKEIDDLERQLEYNNSLIDEYEK